ATGPDGRRREHQHAGGGQTPESLHGNHSFEVGRHGPKQGPPAADILGDGTYSPYRTAETGQSGESAAPARAPRIFTDANGTNGISGTVGSEKRQTYRFVLAWHATPGEHELYSTVTSAGDDE